ncbi:MAG TPA: type II toxin-antitoxin system VapC family toxin [Acidimicrobiales bacterium]|jgi:predicted nucleic acid-binding protein|nr:type II toxin-antitoxin system VapC family toxin [Acidimicrobiales bacterium]
MTSADLLVDTSVAVALVLVDHEQHERTVDAIGDRQVGLSGRAAFETFSVLTRLPPPLRRTPAAVGQILTRNFPASRFLNATRALDLLDRLSQLGIAGGTVYDGLIGAVAVQHHLRLATRDRRAIGTYRALNVDVEVMA